MIVAPGHQSAQLFLGLMTDEALRHIALTSTWFMDGCFSMTTHLFKKMYIVRVLLGTVCSHEYLTLLPGKSHNIYEGHAESDLDRCEELGYSSDPSNILVDFEKTVMNAVHAVFTI